MSGILSDKEKCKKADTLNLMQKIKTELEILANLLVAWPDKQKEARGAAKVLDDWIKGYSEEER